MSGSLAFTHVDVMTGDRDGAVLADQTVLVDESGTIAQVAPSDQV